MSFGSKSLPPPTKGEAERITHAKERGCLACLKMAQATDQIIEYNHINVAGRRVGHRFGYALCTWHHRGVQQGGLTAAGMKLFYGPSLHKGSRTFHQEYGTDQELLDQQDFRIGREQAVIPRRAVRKAYRTPSKIVPRAA